MGILIDIVMSIIFIFFLIGCVAAKWNALNNKNYRRYMIYKNIQKRHSKKKHRH